MNTRAKWAEEVLDFYGRAEIDVSQYLTVAQVSSRVGRAPSTILDLLSRKKITARDNPMGPISRPAGRIGSSPYYSEEQVAAAEELLAAADRKSEDDDEKLPRLSAAECEKLNLISLREISEIAVYRRSPDAPLEPVHVQTIRRWSREALGFPPKLANRAQSGQGAPERMCDRGEVVRWLRINGYHKDVPPPRRRPAKTDAQAEAPA